MKEILLMTSAIRVNKEMAHHKHISEIERAKQYIESLIFYISRSKFSDIVFCDGSGYELNNLKFLNNLAKFYGINLELLSFTYDNGKVVKKGKGFGENIIITYAIKNSILLKEYKSFYKVTGRYKVTNINKIIDNNYNKECVFTKNINMSCNTAFFKISKETFIKYFIGIEESVNDDNGVYLENVYYKTIIKNNLNVDYFKQLPKFSGLSGGGLPLEKSFLYLLTKKILNYLGLMRF